MANNAVINFLFNSQGAIKAIEDFKSKMGQTIDSISKSTAAKFGALGAALGGVASIKKVYDETLKLSELSETFRLPIEQVSKFSNTLALFGGDTDQAVGDLQALEQAITDLWTTASGPLKNVGSQIGLTLSKTDTSLDIIDKLREKFKGLNEDAQIKVAQELGLSSPATLRMLRASNEEYAQMRERAASMGVINSDTQKRVIQFQRTIAGLKQSFIAVGTSLLGFVAPALDKVSQAMEWLANQSDTVKTLVLGLPIAFGALNVALPIITGIGSSFMGLFGIVKYLFALFMANPILLVLAAVAGAAYLIVENWEQVKSYLSGVWNWLKEKAEWLGSVFSKIFIGFLDWIKGIFEKIPFIGKALKDEINSIDSDIELKNSLANKSYPQGAYNYNEDRYNQPVYIYEDDEDESGIYQPMLPNSGSIINNASSTENRITQNFNVNITGTTDNEDLLNRFSGYVRQNTGGVIR